MTRKDYELIAAAIRYHLARVGGLDDAYGIEQCDTIDDGAMAEIADLAVSLADSLATTNPRFDRNRFLKACGVES